MQILTAAPLHTTHRNIIRTLKIFLTHQRKYLFSPGVGAVGDSRCLGWCPRTMSPCVPPSPQPNMAFSPPFLPRPEFGLGGLLAPSSAPGCSLPFPGKYIFKHLKLFFFYKYFFQDWVQQTVLTLPTATPGCSPASPSEHSRPGLRLQRMTTSRTIRK